MKKTLGVFPGQGSQFVGMGKDWYEAFSECREVFEEASESIQVDLKKLCFEGPLESLIQTENCQPCIVTVSVAAARALEKRTNLKIDAVAGHSLGEYSALVFAGALTLTQAIPMVRARGKLMQQAVPLGEGGMAAVMGVNASILHELCMTASGMASEKRQTSSRAWSIPAVVEPANFNSASQIVVSGALDALECLSQLLQTVERARMVMLPVSAPFHSQLMQKARQGLEAIFVDQKAKPLNVGYFPNRSAEIEFSSEKVLPFLAEQVDQPVLWSQTMSKAFSMQFTHVFEFAPGKVLSQLAKKNALECNALITVEAAVDHELFLKKANA